MGLKCGIVGLPNVGKSTLFNALTGGNAQAANYPFCTIDPNIGIAELRDSRLTDLAELVAAANILPAVVEFVDIAGLVKGASDNAGLGNRFLSHIRETDGIAHVVRCFEDSDITHVDGVINPADDIAIINLELMLADLSTVERAVKRAQRNIKAGADDAKRLLAVAGRLSAHLGAGHPARTLTLDDNARAAVEPLCLLTMKPMLYIANVDENGLSDNPHLDAVIALAKIEGAPVVPICAQTEADITNWDEDDKNTLLAEMQLNSDGLARLARVAFDMLDLITYFTAGPKEARAWIIPKKTTAQQAAGIIHTDFARGFIRAEVVHWRDLLACGGEGGAREAGKLRQEGRDYIVADGDVMHFKFNV